MAVRIGSLRLTFIGRLTTAISLVIIMICSINKIIYFFDDLVSTL
jgi:hypothetical protein